MKTFIKNRDGLKVCVVVEGPERAARLAFVMHGLGGNKNQPHVQAMAEAFLEAGYIVITFDATNSFGESGGDYQDATTTNYYADLEAVIGWAGQQSWYAEPFVLAGHSLGGICTALYAEKHPEKIRALAPISTVVSDKLSFETHQLFPRLENLEEWKRNGVSVTESRDGKRKKYLKWSHMEDRLKYDLLPQAGRLTMPVLLVVGEKDMRTPPVHQRQLFDALPGRKEIHTIVDADHSFSRPQEQAELKQFFKDWLRRLEEAD